MPEENPRHRRSYASSIIAFIVIIALGAGCYYAWKIFSSGIEPTPTPIQETPQAIDTSASYASSTMRVAAKYPNSFTLNEKYAYTGVSKAKPISGVQFIVPMHMATGTNLAADSYVSIEQLPRATSCVGDIYLAANVKATKITEGAATYSVASSTETTGGNSYEEVVYALASSTPCTAIRYFIHTTNAGAASTSATTAFDRAGLLAEFDKIRRSVVMQ